GAGWRLRDGDDVRHDYRFGNGEIRSAGNHNWDYAGGGRNTAADARGGQGNCDGNDAGESSAYGAGSAARWAGESCLPRGNVFKRNNQAGGENRHDAGGGDETGERRSEQSL